MPLSLAGFMTLPEVSRAHGRLGVFHFTHQRGRQLDTNGAAVVERYFAGIPSSRYQSASVMVSGSISNWLYSASANTYTSDRRSSCGHFLLSRTMTSNFSSVLNTGSAPVPVSRFLSLV